MEEIAQTEPVQVGFPGSGTIFITLVSAGFGHSAAVDVNGNLYTWGYGGDGSLGLGGLKDAHTPRQVDGLPCPVTSVSCGGCHSVILLNDGSMYACGAEKAVGKALSGTTFKRWQRPDGKESQVYLISAGHHSCFAIVTDLACGAWFFGDEGGPQQREPHQGTFIEAISHHRIVKIQSSRFGAALDCQGRLYVSLLNLAIGTPWKTILEEDVSDMAVGASHIHFVANRKVFRVLFERMSDFSEPELVDGLDRGRMVHVYSGYRTFFALELVEIRVKNRDIMGVLRGPCQACDSCPRFAGMEEVELNSTAAFVCQRCFCSASLHEVWAEVVERKSLGPSASNPTLASQRGSDLKPSGRSLSESSLGGVAMPMHDCKAQIRSLQSRCVTIDASLRKRRLFAVSDIHTDFKGNMKWLHELVEWAGDRFREDIIIVAGDISHDLGIIETTLSLFKQAYGHVFHVCGNHELWVMPKTETIQHGYHKMLEIIQICDKLGVYSHAVVFADQGLGILPLLTWYEPQFVGSTARGGSMEGFDTACRWTDDDTTLATDMLEFNREALLQVSKIAPARVVTFSHFLPRQELWFGWSALGTVMGSKRIDETLRSIKSVAHVFGHSHMNVDRHIEGVHYVQHALGSEPHQRTQSSFLHYKPKEIPL